MILFEMPWHFLALYFEISMLNHALATVLGLYACITQLRVKLVYLNVMGQGVTSVKYSRWRYRDQKKVSFWGVIINPWNWTSEQNLGRFPGSAQRGVRPEGAALHWPRWRVAPPRLGAGHPAAFRGGHRRSKLRKVQHPRGHLGRATSARLWWVVLVTGSIQFVLPVRTDMWPKGSDSAFSPTRGDTDDSESFKALWLCISNGSISWSWHSWAHKLMSKFLYGEIWKTYLCNI